MPEGAAGEIDPDSELEPSGYTPSRLDIGYRLRAMVRYQDGASQDAADRHWAASEAVAVVGRPEPVTSLAAQAGDGQVTLNWLAPSSNGVGADRLRVSP